MSATPLSVELLGSYGGDETHALSAWCSTRREIDDARRARTGAMLASLAANAHHTPFEKSTLHFLVRCSKVEHVHLIKHRIGVSVNAESARYKELTDDDYHVPDDWPESARATLAAACESAIVSYHRLVAELESAGISRKRAKESARYVLPHASHLTQDVSFNFRSFMHFVGLRADAHAQREIRQIAARMLALTSAIEDRGGRAFELSLRAFGWDDDRIERLCEEVGT